MYLKNNLLRNIVIVVWPYKDCGKCPTLPESCLGSLGSRVTHFRSHYFLTSWTITYCNYYSTLIYFILAFLSCKRGSLWGAHHFIHLPFTRNSCSSRVPRICHGKRFCSHCSPRPFSLCGLELGVQQFARSSYRGTASGSQVVSLLWLYFRRGIMKVGFSCCYPPCPGQWPNFHAVVGTELLSQWGIYFLWCGWQGFHRNPCYW